MSEFSTLSDIFGRSAWPIIKEMGGVEVLNVDADDRSCYVMLELSLIHISEPTRPY